MEQQRLVGRDAEVTRLRALLDEAAAGRAMAALVSGDAGVGKTRLTAEVMRLADGMGFTVLSGQCAEIGDSVPYLPIADALRGALLTPEVAARVRDAVAERPALGWLLPEGGAGPPADGDRSGLARQQMFGAVLGLLAELSGENPVLLVLEDLHWADASTRALVTFLSRVLHRERVVLICTYRTDDVHRRHPLRSVVAELRRLPSVTAVELGPLDPAALAEHLASLAAVSDIRQGLPNVHGYLDAAALNDIVERAEGNAYYAEELLAASAAAAPPARVPDEGSLAERTVLPSGLAALLLARVERVSDAAQQVLGAAAVAGRRAGDELIRAASGLSNTDYEEAIREVVAHQLLVPDGADGYAFRHALLREAVYNDLLPGERTRLHAALAALFDEALRANQAEMATVPGIAAELAHHKLASHDIPGAFTASILAGAEAVQRGAPAEAHRHYDQALALWDRVSDAEKLAGMERAKLGLKSANAAAHSGDLARAVHQLRRMREYLRDREVDPELRSRIGERLAYYMLQSEQHQPLSEAVEVARETVDATPGAPPTWYRARAVATYALALLYAGDDEAAREWAERARAAARAARAPWLEADSLVSLGLVSNREGGGDEAVEIFTAAHQQAREARMLGVELRAAYHLASALLSRGELTGAASVAHQGVRRAEETGLVLDPFGLDLQHLHFQAHFADGQWDHAQDIADGFTVRVAILPEALLSAMALFIDVARGNPAADERPVWLEPFIRQDDFCAYIARGLLAEHALWRGDTDLTLHEAAAAISADVEPEHGPAPSVIRVAAVAVAARADRAVRARAAGEDGVAQAEVAAARELLETAREGAAFRWRPKFALGPEGRGWLARAEAEYRRAAGDNDPAAWQAVLAEFGSAYVYEAARTRWRLAEALAESGQRDDAAREWRQAADAAARLGAAPLRAALDDLAHRARLDTGRGDHGHQAPDEPGIAGLTEREREVLRLIARGRSNREIGAELFITPKTASVHVSNILAKLGAASRTEAAAIAHRTGL